MLFYQLKNHVLRAFKGRSLAVPSEGGISLRFKEIGLAGILACAMFLSGCAGFAAGGTGKSAADGSGASYDADAQPDDAAGQDGAAAQDDAAAGQSSAAVQDDAATGQNSAAAQGGDAAGQEDAFRQASGGYYYETLTDDGQRAIYMQMLQSMCRMGQEELLDCRDEEQLYRIFCAVLADHPELFYVTGYSNTEVLQDGEILHMLFSASYSMSAAEAALCKSGIDDVVAACLSYLPDGDDYAKIRYLYEYVICNTEYDLEAPENQNICSVFLYGRSVCQGYAKAFQYLCREAGIEAALVTGRIRESGYRHAWNLVRSNGAYYYVDATWGDASYTMEGAAAAGMPDVNYEYLCVTTEQIERTHEIDLSVAGMPYCTATDDNYYVREHALFTTFDESALDLFLTDRMGRRYITFRCETADVYSAYHDYLIGQEHIFDYMDSPAGVSYSDNEDTLTFGFWLPQSG